MQNDNGVSPATKKNNKAEMWLMSHTSYFKPEHLHVLKERLSRMPEESVDMLMMIELKNPTTILLFSIFLGEIGVDRFMLGDTGMGVAKLLTLGGCLVWWFIDIFLVGGRTKVKNFETVMQTLNLS